MKPIHTCLILLNLLLPGLAAASFFKQDNQQSEFLSAEQAFTLEAVALDHKTIQARWLIEPGHYLYRHRLNIESTQGEKLSWQAPAGKSYQDEHFGEVEIYHDVLDIPVHVSGKQRQVTLKFSWQGCAEAGLCYPPKSKTLSLTLPDCP